MKKSLFVFLIIFFIFSSLSKQKVLAETYFYDDFNHDTNTKWDLLGSTGWTLLNEKFGIRLSPGLSNAIPSDVFWNSSWQNFIFNVDLYGVEGTDKNYLINYVNESNFYEIHHSGGNIHLGKTVGGRYYFLNNNIGSNPVFFPLQNEIYYHFKTIIDNYRIKIYINNELIFDVFDNPPYLNGKPGLRVGTGASSTSEVWFDNVIVCSIDDTCEFPSSSTPTPTPTPTSTPTPTPTATPTPPTPVVFVPGLGGSINFKEMFLGTPDPDGWKMTPGANVYKNLLNAFDENSDFHIFYYDWRKSATESAQKLNQYIEEVVQPWNNKVNIIGHSLGGLIGQTCVQLTADGCFADKLITVGSPHAGVVDAYPLVEAGEVWRKGISKLAFELIIRYYQHPWETRKQTLERVAPILKELLPNFEYLYKNGSILPYSSLTVQNPLLPRLSSQTLLENITKTITGNSFDTLRWITLTDRNWLDKLLGNWPDGKPVEKSYAPEGDKTVFLSSSSFENPLIENFVFDLDHGGIISQASPLAKIFDLINYQLPPDTYSQLNEAENYLVFFVHSPVKLSLSEAPENAYLTDEMIIVPEPENKTYTLNLLGTENSFYLLSVGQIFGDFVSWQDYPQMAVPGENQILEFRINPTDPTLNLLVDPTGTKTREIIRIRIDEFKKEITDLHLKKAFEQILTKQLDMIATNLFNHNLSIKFLETTRKSIAIFENKKVLDFQTATIFRRKALELSDHLEYLTFLKPKKTSKIQAKSLLNSVEVLKKRFNLKILSFSGSLVFLEAENKYNKAKFAFEKESYFQSTVFSQEARSLFQEADLIR